MSHTISLEEAQAKLPELIDTVVAGFEVVITRNQQAVAKLVATAPPPRTPRRPGTLRGTVIYMAADFDAPLDDFKEYME